MVRVKKSVIAAGVVLGMMSSSPVGAQVDAGAGTAGFTFLKIAQHARLAAMGSAAVADASDASAFQLNPAGLAQQRTRNWTVSYSNLFVDVQSGLVSYSQAVENQTVVGVSLVYLSSTGIPRTSVEGGDLGTFGFSDLAFGVSVGTRVVGPPDTLDALLARRFGVDETLRIDAGATVRGIYEKLDTYSASGFSVDMGVLALLPDNRTRVGVSVTHLGKQTSAFVNTKEKLPTEIRAGLRHRLRGAPILVVADVLLPRDNKARFAVGFEAMLVSSKSGSSPLALRAGYNSQGRDLVTESSDDAIAGFSTGIGLGWKQYTLDYSFTPRSGLGALHRFTISGQIQ